MIKYFNFNLTRKKDKKDNDRKTFIKFDLSPIKKEIIINNEIIIRIIFL